MLLDSLKSFFSRRDLFRGAGVAAMAGFSNTSATGAGLEIGPNIYRSIGVRPVVNCKGTFTIISGSQSLPEVKRAMEEASRHYVHLDELMDAVGKRLAELTGAEFGIVTNGCAAALVHATAACVAGSDPEKMQRLPDTRGLKNEVIAPRWSRNVYDHAVRATGVKFIEAGSLEEFQAAFTPRTAMVMILASPEDAKPFGLEAISRIAKQHHVPVLVDAAAERLTVPNVHLQRGADLVAYSGGKCLRGPQSAGLLLGRKDLVKAAWINSAPHHAFGRPMKAGKEEIMGMLAAVEMWMKRDHKAEWKQWEGWLDHIATRLKKIESVTTEVLQPEGLSNNSPRLRVSWDAAKVGINGSDLEKVLFEGEPRIVLGGASGSSRDGGRSSLTIMPYMMMPGDEKIAAERIYAVMANPPKIEHPRNSGTPAQVGGQWELHIDYISGSADHVLVLEQNGTQLVGTHQGDILAGDLRGSVEGEHIHFRSSHRIEGTRLGFEFAGRLQGNELSGTVDMGEYGRAEWRAKRHQYGTPGGLVRPVKNV